MGPSMMRRVRSLVTLASAAVVATACPPQPAPPAPPTVVTFAVAGAPFSEPALVAFTWSVRDVNLDELTCRIDADGDGTWDITMSPCQRTGSRVVPASEGTYSARFDVADADHAPVERTASYAVAAGPTETYDIVTLVGSADPRIAEAAAVAESTWESILVRGVPDAFVQLPAGGCADAPAFEGAVDDLVIQVVLADIEGEGAAAPCVTGPDQLPRLSVVLLNPERIDGMHSYGLLDDLLVHEFAHALGFTGQRWGDFRVDTGAERLQFVGPRAVAEWSRIGGAGPIPLSHGGDHWSEDDLQSELMTCHLEFATPNPLSGITVAAMADLGYHVDLSAAAPYELPTEPGLLTC